MLTVHDLAFLLYPECADARLREYLMAVVPRSVRAADFVVTDSANTQNDVICLLGADPARTDGASVVNRTSPAPSAPAPAANLKDALLSEIRSSNATMYNTLVAQAQRMQIDGDRVVLAFAAAQKIGSTFDKYKPTLEALATRLAGRRMAVVAEIGGPANGADEPTAAAAVESDRKKSALREQALGDPGVQALLEVFPAEIRDVEEM